MTFVTVADELPATEVTVTQNDVAVTVTSLSTVVTVQVADGPPGPRGLKGDQGDPGDPGADPVPDFMTHTQNVPSTLWTVAHNLGKFPSVGLRDTAGTSFIATITHIDENNLTVGTAQPQTGYADCN